MKKITRRRSKNNAVSLSENLHPVLRKIYINRGITSDSELEKDLNKLIPFENLLNIGCAVKLLFKHIQQQTRILIIGDFDADGATSCALAVGALKALGARNVDYLVPNRFDYGYGLTPEIVEVAMGFEPGLIVTVDNGISSCNGVKVAKKHGVDVLITDHHLPGIEVPKADAIVNPNQQNDTFGSKNLAGVGVIFYVMLALRSHMREKKWFELNDILEPNMANFLDLVALGTVADIVPLDKNNRILVCQGLKRIRAGNCCQGIKNLIEISKRNQRDISANDLAYAVGPRLNAAGRLDDMSLGIECLMTKDTNKAGEMVLQLNALNEERRAIEKEMQQQAWDELKKLELSKCKTLPTGLCLYDKGWHQGVIGLLASRVKERLHRPVIAFAPFDQNLLKGSGRSIDGLHIRDTLDTIATKHPGLLSKFGGHAMAAGLSLETKNFEAFKKAFDEEVTLHLDKKMLQHEILSDGELRSEDLSLPLAQLLRDSGPWGQLFEEPLFDGKFHVVQQRLVGNRHLKLLLGLDDAVYIDAIAFNVDIETWPDNRSEYIHAAYRLDINEYRGVRKVQLIIEHFDRIDVGCDRA